MFSNNKVDRYTGDYSVTHWAGKKFKMNETLGYKINGVKWCIVKGKLTDFSSTPIFYDFFVKPVRVNAAGAIHDAAYQDAKPCVLYDCDQITRADADKSWRLVAQLGQPGYSANKAQAWAGWLGLRIGGWVAWNKYRKKGTPQC